MIKDSIQYTGTVYGNLLWVACVRADLFEMESQLCPSRPGPSSLTTNTASLDSYWLSFTVTMTDPNARIGSPVYVHSGRGSPECCSGGEVSESQSLLKVALLMRENATPVSTSMSNGQLAIRTALWRNDTADFCMTTAYKVYSLAEFNSLSTMCVMCLSYVSHLARSSICIFSFEVALSSPVLNATSVTLW